MAKKKRTRRRWPARLHFLVRVLGLLGLIAVIVGAALANVEGLFAVRDDNRPLWENVVAGVMAVYETSHAAITNVINGVEEKLYPLRLVVGLLVIGGALALFALLLEILMVLGYVAGRRSAFGGNVVIQTALAVALVVGINWYSFSHYRRIDTTRDGLFTLPTSVRDQLRRLEKDTTIVVYQRHKTFGSLSDKPDRYDYAAERKVVEKVRDLVDQFRELGPQFLVTVLDVEQEDFDAQLAALPEELRRAIDRAPENSIFFQAGDRVQRLSFNDFYQLDKTASQEANEDQGNLVLRYQGVEPFARKVLDVEEKRPRIAFAVTHELLTSGGAAEEYTLAGARKVLEERGFDVRDLILKKWRGRAGPEAAVYTYDESKFERLADRVEVLNRNLAFAEKQLDAWKTMPVAELVKRKFDESDRKEQVQNWSSLVEQATREKDRAVADQQRLQVESLAEQRRLTDVQAKMERALADCDLLILPRMTLRNVTMPPFNVPNEVHRLDDSQVSAIRTYLKSGKPVLACFGPVNESPEERPSPMSGPDKLEELLTELGFRLSRQTVLFDREIGALAEYQAALQGRREVDLMSRGDDTDIPPLVLERVGKSASSQMTPNPIRESLRLTARGLGRGQNLDLRSRHPRPVTYEPRGSTLSTEAEFLLTDPESWAEDQPFPTEKDLPRYDETKRRGPAPVGVAAEVAIPAEWLKDMPGSTSRTVRMAAIGQGSLFVGPTLPPAKEKLLLDTCNWLLGRDDQLTQEGPLWSYPRVQLSEGRDAHLKWLTVWTWGTTIGLPALMGVWGLIVIMWRRVW